MSTLTVSLADQINEQIRLAEQSLRTAVEHAWNAGRLLAEQKDGLAHGEWLPWLEQNVNLSPRRAQEWMDLAVSYARAPAHLTIDEALREARKQRAPEPKVDVAGALRGLAPPAEAEQRLDAARERLQAEPKGAWTEGQQRKRHKTIDHLEQTRGILDDASSDRLSPYAVAELLRQAAIEARHAASVLDDLAFTFER